MAIDVSTDHEIFDNVEALTITLKRNAGDTTVEVTKALPQQVDRSEAEGAGVRLTGQTKQWSIAVAEMGSSEISEGDTATDSDDVVWTIRSAALKAWDSSWVIICQRERT